MYSRVQSLETQSVKTQKCSEEERKVMSSYSKVIFLRWISSAFLVGPRCLSVGCQASGWWMQVVWSCKTWLTQKVVFINSPPAPLLKACPPNPLRSPDWKWLDLWVLKLRLFLSEKSGWQRAVKTKMFSPRWSPAINAYLSFPTFLAKCTPSLEDQLFLVLF